MDPDILDSLSVGFPNRDQTPDCWIPLSFVLTKIGSYDPASFLSAGAFCARGGGGSNIRASQNLTSTINQNTIHSITSSNSTNIISSAITYSYMIWHHRTINKSSCR